MFGQVASNGAVSVLDSVSIGSSLSVQRYSRMGCAVSTYNEARLGSRVSVLDMFTCGSSLSISSFGRLGSGASLFGCLRVDWQGLSANGQTEIGS